MSTTQSWSGESNNDGGERSESESENDRRRRWRYKMHADGANADSGADVDADPHSLYYEIRPLELNQLPLSETHSQI